MRRTTPGRRVDPAPHPLRADAARNRTRILLAAREVFAERGLNAAMTEVARRADVGIATLLRRFPTRDELITATFADKMAAYARAIDTALVDPDPWQAFCTYIEEVCAMQAADRGFCNVLTLTFPTAKSFESERNRAYRGFTELIRRAKAAGTLRADFSAEDLPLLLMANAGVISATGDAAPKASRRLVGYFLQASAAQTAPPLPAAPTPRQMYRALLRLQPAKH